MSFQTSRRGPGDAAGEGDPLLDLAVVLVAEKGADGFSMDELAARAGLSRATLYRRFGSQRALLERLATERGVDVAARDPDVRQRILDATRVVIGRVGFVSATVEQIAEQAGVGPATVYRHFGSRQGLLETFRASMPARKVVHELASCPGPDVEGELERFAAEATRFLRDNGDLIRVSMLSVEDEAGLAELRARPNRTMHLLAQYLDKQMRAGRIREEDPLVLAGAFFGMLFMFGALGPAVHDLPRLEPAEVARSVTRLFLRGAAPSALPAKPSTRKRRSDP